MAEQDNIFVDIDVCNEHLKRDGIEMKRRTYNPSYNVYAQEVNLQDEQEARVRELENDSAEGSNFQDVVIASLHTKSSDVPHKQALRQASSGISSAHSNESDKQDSDKDTVSIEGAEGKKREYTEEERLMLEKLRKVVELCTRPEPIKRPTSKEILEMLKI
ncbi:uncharacterized protein LOC100370546 [Saccoglossus kowalevskii]|uniref:Uncharacterized protein LOC100370546 n=1 Tax=Saccoglossus kowalevskii TaxID=10224 RepID=A0ABM0GLW5_SACKO|nr:PREDICTED: uncharacterized protein LOC100370546 [Saccoglossus kowalevskii]